MIYEVTVFWEGEFYAHEALSHAEAVEWAAQYQRPADESCKVRIWAKGYPTE